TGQVPAPIFDTQIAAMVCGFGDSVGYQQLVAHFTGAQIDKSARFTDWSARPLRDSQITYALGDVIYLRDVYEALSDALEAKKRTNWIAEDMAALTDPESYDQPPELAWKRIKGRLRGAERLGRLRALAAWRDEFAKRKNRPRGRILRDEVLVGLAQSPPNSLESLAKFRGIDAGFARSMAGQELLEALKSSTPFSATELAALEKRGNKKASHEPALSLLKLVLKITAQEHDVAPKVIVGSRELEQFLEDPEAVQSVTTGWRAEVFGSRALAFLRGELAISYENGDVRIADIAQPAMAKSDDQRSEIA
ncbi:MAG: HRDC domain-containing protein, partial [Pseudomonadota bacterium]